MSRSVVRGAKHMGTKSTVKHNNPSIKSTQKMRMPRSAVMEHHLQQQARTPGLRARQPPAQKPGWAHKQLV
jgi:hypothetical protein